MVLMNWADIPNLKDRFQSPVNPPVTTHGLMDAQRRHEENPENILFVKIGKQEKRYHEWQTHFWNVLRIKAFPAFVGLLLLGDYRPERAGNVSRAMLTGPYF